MKTKALNLPNVLSLLRMALVPFFVWAVVALDPATLAGRLIPAGIFAVTAFTDFLDGNIARRKNLVTNFGKFIDPLADKFMVFGALFALVYRYAYLGNPLLWCAVVVVFRDLAVTGLRLSASAGKSRAVIAASWPGKVKTVTQILGILLIILEPLLWGVYGAEISPLAYIGMAAMALAALYSGVDYFIHYLPVLDFND